MSKEKKTGWDSRTKTRIQSYEFMERVVKIGDIIKNVAITDIYRVEWITRIKPVKKCVHEIHYLVLDTGHHGELESSSFRLYFLLEDSNEVPTRSEDQS